MISAMVSAGLVGGYITNPRLAAVHWQAGDRALPPSQVSVAGESVLWVDPAEIPADSDVAKVGLALATVDRGDLYELVANVAAYSGLRWGELAALTIPQIDQPARAITVDRKIVEVAGQLYLEAPKNRKRRRTIYPRRTPADYPLAERLAARIEEARAEQQAGANPLGLIFPSRKGTYWRSSNFNRRVLAPAYWAAGWRDAEGNGAWTWHSLRHVFCTTALFTWKLDPTDVSRMAGHANYRITLEMYIGATARVLDRARGHRVAVLSHLGYLTVLLAASPGLPTVDSMTSSHHEASPSRDPVAVQEGRPPDQLISIGDIRALFKLGRTAAYELTRRPDFPVPVQVSRRCLRWRGRSLWSRPVAQEWAEQRQRSPDGVDAVVSAPGGRGEPVPAGQARAAAALTRSFMAGLWEYRPFRSRWALRWRTRGHVEEIATDLAGDAASYMVRDLIPADALAATVRHAFLDEIAEGIRLSGRAPADATFYGITPKVARMLGWLALHRPHMAGFAISEIIGDAEGRLGVPRRVTEQTIQTALDLDGGMDDYLDEFLDRVLTPPPACRHQISSRPPPAAVRLTTRGNRGFPGSPRRGWSPPTRSRRREFEPPAFCTPCSRVSSGRVGSGRTSACQPG